MLKDSSEKISSIIAILPSLIQIVAAVAISFTESLKLKTIFMHGDLLFLFNFIALLLSLILIGVISSIEELQVFRFDVQESKLLKWFKEKWFVPRDQASRIPGYGSSGIEKSNSTKRKVLWALFLIDIFFAFAFLMVTLLYIENIEILKSNSKLALYQSLAYISFLVVTAALLFVWVKSSIEKTNRYSKEQFIDNFKESLAKYGYLDKPIEITRNTDHRESDPEVGFRMGKKVRCKIAGNSFEFFVSDRGEEIYSCDPIPPEATQQSTGL